MREGMGLYKAKRVDNGKWVEGNLVLSNDAQDDFKAIIIPQTNNGIFTKHTGFKNISCYLGFEEWYKVDESTLCQWTGLVDKNGAKVFEGDIIECWSEGVKARGTVTQRIDGLWIIYPAWQENKMWGLCPNESGVADVEVIGNIHDKAVEE